MAPSIDRRAARSRRALQTAMARLILRKPYGTITVQDIIDEADVGRATFYAHFAGKDDLFRNGFERLRDDLAAGRRRHAGKSEDAAHPLSFSFAMFEHASRYKEVGALLGEGGSTIARTEARRILAEFVKADLPAGGDGTISRELLVEYVVSSFLTVLTWWLTRKPSLSPQEVDLMFRRLVIHGAWPHQTG